MPFTDQLIHRVTIQTRTDPAATARGGQAAVWTTTATGVPARVIWQDSGRAHGQAGFYIEHAKENMRRCAKVLLDGRRWLDNNNRFLYTDATVSPSTERKLKVILSYPSNQDAPYTSCIVEEQPN